jgi:hypothetical protein
LLADVGGGVAKHEVGVRRHVDEATDIIRDENGIGNDAHDIAVQRLLLLKSFGSCAVFGHVIEPILELGYLRAEVAVLVN